ncbi:response regulator, partial [Candidatus Magnetoovum chiemensis]
MNNESNAQQKSTILVIDDTPDNITILSGLLKDKYKVKVANSGERALKIAASDSKLDLILLDIM